MRIEVRQIAPMGDSVLIERLEPIEQEQTGLIIKPDKRRDEGKMILRKGRVLAVGPGKWIPGTWWKVKQYANTHGIERGNIDLLDWREWEWLDGYRETPEVKPGMTVIFNARWNDLAHAELKPQGPDIKSRTWPLERPLSYRYDSRIHLVQEADIAGWLP